MKQEQMFVCALLQYRQYSAWGKLKGPNCLTKKVTEGERWEDTLPPIVGNRTVREDYRHG
jgi:hypothetical protein